MVNDHTVRVLDGVTRYEFEGAWSLKPVHKYGNIDKTKLNCIKSEKKLSQKYQLKFFRMNLLLQKISRNPFLQAQS